MRPSHAEAAELRAPMAWTVIGGLLTSTLLTLVVVPVLYDFAGGRRKTA
jgi:HAE1 family hydrophobic/amphiphilic exporter-1